MKSELPVNLVYRYQEPGTDEEWRAYPYPIYDYEVVVLPSRLLRHSQNCLGSPARSRMKLRIRAISPSDRDVRKYSEPRSRNCTKLYGMIHSFRRFVRVPPLRSILQAVQISIAPRRTSREALFSCCLILLGIDVETHSLLSSLWFSFEISTAVTTLRNIHGNSAKALR